MYFLFHNAHFDNTFRSMNIVGDIICYSSRRKQAPNFVTDSLRCQKMLKNKDVIFIVKHLNGYDAGSNYLGLFQLDNIVLYTSTTQEPWSLSTLPIHFSNDTSTSASFHSPIYQHSKNSRLSISLQILVVKFLPIRMLKCPTRTSKTPAMLKLLGLTYVYGWGKQG